MSGDGFDDLRKLASQQADLDQKVNDAKAKRVKAQQSGSQKDFQDAVLAELDAIKAKLGMT